MRALSLLLILVVVAVGSSTKAQESPATRPATAPATAPVLTQEQVVTEIKKWGGTVDRDGNVPDGAVVGVGFGWEMDHSKAVPDVGLEHLNELNRLRSLGVWDGINVTDAGVEHLKSLNTLQVLVLNGATRITDVGLDHLKGLDKLQALSLKGSNVTDTGLERLRGLKQLQKLYLDHTKVTDAGLEHLKGLNQLQELSLAGTKVSDAGLENLKGLEQLITLQLDITKVTDAGLGRLKELKQLQHLHLAGTKVSDAGLENLKGLNQLRGLRLGGTKVTDAGLQYLEGLNQLQYLDLVGTNVTDAGLEHLKGLNQLTNLNLEGTKVSDQGMKRIQESLPKCSIRPPHPFPDFYPPRQTAAIRYLSLLGFGLMIFVSTDIDDLLLLIVLFSDRRLSFRRIILGQYLGFLGLVAASVACSLLAIIIPGYWLGLLGVWPLLLGVHRLFNRATGDVIGVSAKAAAPAVGILTVALLTLANGGDNITVYTPVFARLTAGQIVIVVVEFLFLIALWCGAARFIVTHSITGGAIRRIAHAILPYVLIGLGMWVLLRSLLVMVQGH